MLLARMIRDEAGGDAASALRFAHRELFDKLGMEHVTPEFDGAGTPIGSSHMWASARDWAQFGQLYLDDGVVGGERILPQGWVDYSARLTPGSQTYGYGEASGPIAARPAGRPSASGSACRPTPSWRAAPRRNIS
jgi:CubicO group peptidase (beta-lactamase class C family)